MRPLVIRAMAGLGDTFYQRPFLRALAEERGEVWVRTPWPQLLGDIPGLYPVPFPRLSLRTQAKNQETAPGFHQEPEGAEVRHIFYGLRTQGETILEELSRLYGLDPDPLRMDTPPVGPSPVRTGKPVAVVRPVTLRREWMNPARSAHPDYVAFAAAWLREAGYHVVSVAYVEHPQEWMLTPAPRADTYLTKGQLGPEELVALVAHASVVVGGVGWIVPMSLATDTPAVIIGGGQGGYNAPERVTDPRIPARPAFLLPEPYCTCKNQFHDCPKYIPGFRDRFGPTVERVTALEVAACAA